MRQYRGKRIDNGEWVSGCYLTQRSNDGLKHMISVQDMWAFHEVDPKTVGEDTEIPDDNERYIFRYDIVDCFRSGLAVVTYEGGSFGLRNKAEGFVPFRDIHGAMTVVGNVADNPELLEVGKDA